MGRGQAWPGGPPRIPDKRAPRPFFASATALPSSALPPLLSRLPLPKPWKELLHPLAEAGGGRHRGCCLHPGLARPGSALCPGLGRLAPGRLPRQALSSQGRCSAAAIRIAQALCSRVYIVVRMGQQDGRGRAGLAAAGHEGSGSAGSNLALCIALMEYRLAAAGRPQGVARGAPRPSQAARGAQRGRHGGLKVRGPAPPGRAAASHNPPSLESREPNEVS